MVIESRVRGPSSRLHDGLRGPALVRAVHDGSLPVSDLPPFVKLFGVLFAIFVTWAVFLGYHLR